jgi:hypothetical protein
MRGRTSAHLETGVQSPDVGARVSGTGRWERRMGCRSSHQIQTSTGVAPSTCKAVGTVSAHPIFARKPCGSFLHVCTNPARHPEHVQEHTGVMIEHLFCELSRLSAWMRCQLRIWAESLDSGCGVDSSGLCRCRRPAGRWLAYTHDAVRSMNHGDDD